MNFRLLSIAIALSTFTACQSASTLPETGKQFEALAGFDEMMRNFMLENEIPGAALAVAKDGRLVYARGFGYANRKRREPVQPDSLFRIASISKPLTAVATLQLIEQGKLKLDDRVFKLLPHKAHLPKGGKIDPRLNDITLAHLMRHQGGWDRGKSIDPMFHSIEIATALGKRPPANPDDIIRFMKGWPLDFKPGTRYSYSNLGYCLLGRVIEQTTGRGYEAYLKNSVLKPLGITRMRTGKTLAAQRAPGEVTYYPRGELVGLAVTGPHLGAKVPRPYGAWNLESMDSLGAWIASATDLVRFGSAVDRFEKSKILNAQSMKTMLTRPKGHFGNDEKGKPDKTYYGCGWSVRPVAGSKKPNRWHTGHLSGTSTILVLRHDGLCWAALFNTNQTPDKKRPCKKIDPLIHEAADAVKAWPKHDLFERKKN
jgi:N-acyl-D-amino-acid deacylase